MNRIVKSMSLLLLLLPVPPLAGQQEQEPLVPGAVRSGVLAAEEADTLALALEAGSLVTGVARQESLDVVVSVRDPRGVPVGRFDASATGGERFRFEADSAGTYRIEVRPFGEGAGAYSLVVESVEPVATDPAARVDQLMAAYDGEEVPGGVVAVVRNGEIVFSRAYGMADLTHGVPFETGTPTNIGSTSKQFTAFALALLEERGELSLDDDVRAHVPELPDFGEPVTLRHLLTHTTGYREFLNTLALAGRRLDEGDYIDRSELIAVVRRQPELQNAPGAEWNYNNTAFGLAALVVERVSGEPFPEWMRENVFLPLGMTNTVVRGHPAQLVPGRSAGYVPNKREGWREASDLGGAMGAGGIYTTVADLARWMGNFSEPVVGGPELFDRMTTRYVLADGDTTSYGLGLSVDEHRGLARVHHGGADVAHRAMLRYYPEIDAGVVALSNNAGFPSAAVADEVAGLFFGEHMEPEGEEAVAGSPGAPFDPGDFDPEGFDDYAGRYALDEAPAFVLRFWREEDRFWTRATGQEAVEIVPTSDSTFALSVVEASVTFHRDAAGDVASITLHQNGDHPATRLEGAAWAPSPGELAVYVGRFYSEELETFYEIELEDDGLVLHHRRMSEGIELRPGQRTDAFTAGFPLAEVVFRRNAEGDVVGLTVANGRTRDVQFERVEAGTAPPGRQPR